DYQALLLAGIVITMLLVSAIALVHPVARPQHESWLAVPFATDFTALRSVVNLTQIRLTVHPVKGAAESAVAVGLPSGVAAGFLLLTLVSTSAIRFLAVWLR